jgi:hypothetical protein
MSSVHKFRSLAAAVTIALAPAASFGVGYDIVRDTTFAGVATTGAIVPEGTGDSVLYPYYTVANGANTSFSLTNTSTSATVAAKVRFRDAQFSQDQLDFIVVLSPLDKFDFFVRRIGGETEVVWSDNSCVIGYPGSVYDDEKSLSFRGDYANTLTGHMEVIGMVNLNGVEDGAGNDLDDAAKHAPMRNPNNPTELAMYPENCGTLKRAFVSRADVNALRMEAGGPVLSQDDFQLTLQDVPNVLMGSQVITVPGAGLEAGTDAIMVQNTFQRGFLAAQSPETCQLGVTVASGTDPTALTQGTDGCYSVVSADFREWDHPNLRDINWVGAVIPAVLGGALVPGVNTVAVLDELMTAQAIAGDWSNNRDNFVGTDWVVPFVTKYVYMDGTDLCNAGDKVDGTWNDAIACRATPTPFTAAVIGSVHVQGFDEEVTTIASPGIPIGQPGISNEVNVFTFANESNVPAPLPSFLTDNRDTLRFSDSLNAVRGWAEMEILWYPNTGGTAGDIPTHAINNLDGASVVPLNWTVRATSNVMQNDVSLRGLSRINDIDALLPPTANRP